MDYILTETKISSTIVVLWESDLDFDSDGNGDARDDWITPSGADRIRVAASWEDVGIKSVGFSLRWNGSLSTKIPKLQFG